MQYHVQYRMKLQVSYHNYLYLRLKGDHTLPFVPVVGMELYLGDADRILELRAQTVVWISHQKTFEVWVEDEPYSWLNGPEYLAETALYLSEDGWQLVKPLPPPEEIPAPYLEAQPDLQNHKKG